MQWNKAAMGALLAALAGPALAQVDFYAGANIGVTDYDFTDENAVALSGVFGVYMTPYLSAEVGILDLGELDEYIDPDDNIYTRDSVSVRGVNLALRGVFPVDDTLELYGKIGMFLWRAEAKEDDFDYHKLEDGQNLSGGVGLTWLLTPNFGLNVEWQRFDLEDTYASSTSVGVRFEF